MIESLKQELKRYYATCSSHVVQLPFNPLQERLDAFAAKHPELSAAQLKAAQYEFIAEEFQPVLFPHSPFFFETGLKIAEYDGCAEQSTGGWLFLRNRHLYRDRSPEDDAAYQAGDELGLHLAYGPYCDYDHHAFPFSRLLRHGLVGIQEQLLEGRRKNPAPECHEFYDTALRGVNAVQRIAERFAEAARNKLPLAQSTQERKNLERIAATAEKMPWHPPQTFYEGLACLRFFHELGGVLDGIGMSVLGLPDRQLIKLYRDDLAASRITEKEARELIGLYLVQTDCKLDFARPVSEQFNAGEQGDTLVLGGLDAEGNDQTNELTMLFLQVHRELELVYPKIHCRVSAATPEALFLETAKDFLSGRNLLSFLNDDILLPALHAAGKTKDDAANYVAGGCWEVIAEGREHSEGANCYFSLAKAMDLSIHHVPEQEAQLALSFQKLGTETSFEEIYALCMANVKLALRQIMTLIAKHGVIWPQVNPCPFFSACLKGCAESGLDYTAGGARYSPHGLPFTGLAIYVDSLIALDSLCFNEQPIPLQEVLKAIRADWEGYEALRLRAIASAHLGDGAGKAAGLAARILNEVADFVATFRNERGGDFQCGLYSYVDIVQWAPRTLATPDGRRRGDFLAQGLTPSRLHQDDLAAVFRDISTLPLERFPANSVLTLSLSRSGLDPARVAAFLRTWCTQKAGGMLQLNCTTREELEDALAHPLEHQELIVRLYGYSARFVTLDEARRKEFLSRTLY